MAKERRSIGDLFTRSKKIQNNLNLLDTSISDLYQDTYSATKSDYNDSEKIRTDIDNSITNINNGNGYDTSIGSMTKIYSRLANGGTGDSKEIMDSLNVFTDQSLMDNMISTWMDNKWIKDLDNEIDMVLKYMPKLKEAMACKKDCVLSADHFAKDFISYHNIMSDTKTQLYNSRMSEIIRTYDLANKYEQWYDDAQIYGEQFIYIVPYNEAFKRLLQTKQDVVHPAVRECTIVREGALQGSYQPSNDEISSLCKDLMEETGLSNIKVSFSNGLLESSSNNLERVKKIMESSGMSSLKEMHIESVNEANMAAPKQYFGKNKSAGDLKSFSDKLVPDELEVPKDFDDDNGAEMLIGSKKESSKEKINVPGCIVKALLRENVVPIYIEDVCLGYYYFEFRDEFNSFDPNNFENSTGIDRVNNRGGNNNNSNNMRTGDRNAAINHIASQLSDTIDATFINANQDLRKEIFMILNHNNIFNSKDRSASDSANINVTFIPAEDITHITFTKDKVTHRGISDLMYALFPAKLYSSLYITDTLAKITRGQDKRVYYVKQNIESNVSRTLLNVINQIKKGNFGARQMENLSNILNITGRFNDLLIPLSQSGEAPVTMDIMPGQQFTDNSELMTMLEKMAINTTDVPYDLIETRQSLDYAIQATMSNSKLMRNTYKRQDAYEIFLSEINSKIYNYEFGENERIEVELPAPAFLNVTNGAQLVTGTIEYLESIVNVDGNDMTDEEKLEFKKLGLRYYIPSHLNLSILDKLKTRARINVKNRLPKSDDE